jgi:histone deacetylase HOS3
MAPPSQNAAERIEGNVITGGPIAIPESDDIDTLTTGMRKVKISLVTKEQREAREQAKVAAKPTIARPVKTATTRAPRAKTVGKPVNGSANTKPTTPSAQDQQSAPTIEQNFATQQSTAMQQPSQSRADSASAVPTTLPLADSTQNVAVPIQQPILQERISSPGLEHPSLPLLSPPTSNTPDVFIPYQPEGPTPDTRVPQNGLQWLPPNTATPSASKFGDLPVFTSTGAIPFGVKKESSVNDVNMEVATATMSNNV